MWSRRAQPSSAVCANNFMLQPHGHLHPGNGLVDLISPMGAVITSHFRRSSSQLECLPVGDELGMPCEFRFKIARG